jgi:putative ABC transport system permease protein
MVKVGLLTRKLLRDVWIARWQVTAVTAMVFLGVTMFIGIYGGYLNLQNSYHHTYKQLNMADYWLSVDQLSRRAVTKIRAIPGVAAEGRIVRDVQLSISEQRQERVVVRIISLPGDRRTTVNGVWVERGSYFSGDNAREALVHTTFADHNGIEPGDWITLKVDHEETRFQVAGIANSPEYLFVSKSPSEPMPSPSNFGVLFLPQGRTEMLFDMKSMVNEIVFTFDEKAKIGATMDQVRSVLRDYGVGRVEIKGEPTSLAARKQDTVRGLGIARMITRMDQPSEMMLRMDLNLFSQLAVVFPVFFLVLGAVTTYVLLGRLIAAQRPQIGLLKAMGYSRRRVIGHYLGFGALIGITGSLLGVLAGWYLSIIFPQMYVKVIVSLPLVQAEPHWPVMAVGAFTGVGIAILASLAPARVAASMRPAESMRPSVVGNGRRPLLERLVPIPARMPMVSKLALRNIFRSPGRSLFMVGGVVAAASLILTSAIFLDSIERLLDLEYNQIKSYQAKVVLGGLNSASLAFQPRHWQGVRQAEAILEVPYRFRYGDKYKDGFLVGLPPEQSLYNLFSPEGQPVSVEPDQLLLTAFLQKRLGVKTGDIVQLEPIAGVIGAKQVRVGDIIELPIGGSKVFMPLKQVQKMFKVPGTANSLLLDFQGDPSPELRQRVYDLPGMEGLTFKTAEKAFFDELMVCFYAFIYVMLLFGFALGATIVFSAITISVHERVREVSTLRTIGMSMWGVTSLVTLENLILGGLGIALGLPLGKQLALSFFDLVQSEEFTMTATLYPSTYLVTSLGLLVVLLVSQIPSLRYISHLNLASATKDWTT